MKIANIDREILHIFWTTWGTSMKIWGKMWLKSHEKPGFQPPFRSVDDKRTLPNRFRVKGYFQNTYFQFQKQPFCVSYDNLLGIWRIWNLKAFETYVFHKFLEKYMAVNVKFTMNKVIFLH